MLTALKQGVKGGKWFSLMDKVYALGNLRKAFQQVKTNGGAAGVDHQTIKMFECHLEQNLGTLSRSLKDGSYRPQAVRRAWIPKLGSKEKRPLEYPRFETGWRKQRSARCWNRFSNGTLPITVMGSARIGAARMHCVASTAY